MEQDAWDDLSAALMQRMGWSWRDLCETPLSVIEAVLDRLNGNAGGSGRSDG